MIKNHLVVKTIYTLINNKVFNFPSHCAQCSAFLQFCLYLNVVIY